MTALQKRALFTAGDFHSGHLGEILGEHLNPTAASQQIARWRQKGFIKQVGTIQAVGRPRAVYRLLTDEERQREAERVWCLAAMQSGL